MPLVHKIGNVEELVLVPADEFADVDASELVEWITQGHTAIKMAVRRLAIHVAQVGAWLVAAREKQEHGGWLPWLAINCPEISRRTAYNYIETYEKIKDTNLQLIANLTPIQAYRELGIVKDPTDPPPVETPPLPEGKYYCLIIDPPWPVQKIERDVRLNQQKPLDYPTMTIEEIKHFDISPVANPEGCHLYLWTTHKFLPDAFDIMAEWGFKYIFTMVWHKSGGFQPFGLPQYNCEFVLFGKMGNMKFISTKNFPCCFNGERGKHSEKPDEFYNLIERVAPAPRLDMFARKRRDGWDVWGNEV